MPTAEQLERARDLRTQLQGIGQEDQAEIIFRETSPPKRRIRLYSRMDGEPIDVPSYVAEKALEKVLPNGTFMFTTAQGDAPEYKRGSVKCFLHAESAERASGALDAVGLSGITCDSAGLASIYSKRIHAQHRHRQQWEAYQEHVSDQKQRTSDMRQDQQLEATLALAKQAVAPAAAPAATPFACADCDKQFGSLKSLQGHRLGAHREKPDA